jgi:hypothetical protein
MIILNVMGGLGNQMFQYAFGLALAQSTGQEVRFILDTLSKHKSARTFDLQNVFGLNPPLASDADLEKMIGHWRKRAWIRRVLSRRSFRLIGGPHFISESHYSSVPKHEALSLKGAYFHGYWQSQDYFMSASNCVRKSFQFVGDSCPANHAVRERMNAAPSIGIHVRRGDYVSNPKAASKHGVLSPDHYVRAVENLRQAMPGARVFAFSDDPKWLQCFVESHFENAECILNNVGTKSFRDMQLMTNCDALVIANSSFSWWAAWLNNKPRKIIVAPKRWFQNPNFNTAKLIPSDWRIM